MSVVESGSSQQENEDTIELGATPLELFFDLVFVFAFTQVTSFLSDDLAWAGMLQGAALLAELTSFAPMAYACRCSVLRKYTNRSGNTLVSK